MLAQDATETSVDIPGSGMSVFCAAVPMPYPLRPGFFVPYQEDLPPPQPTFRALEPVFARSRDAYAGTLEAVARFGPDLLAVARGLRPAAGERPPRLDQEWFPRLDALAAYALLRSWRPRRVVEIGAGHSTRLLCQALVDGAIAADVTCIDPQPRAGLEGLPIRHLAVPLAAAPRAVVDALEAGDVLFVDSSHVASPGTDVEEIVLDILPRLPAGAYVHFHDIFLPDAYPAGWEARRYNEHVAVAALLQGGAFTPVFASHYVLTRTGLVGGSLVADLPRPAGALESSLWLRKRTD